MQLLPLHMDNVFSLPNEADRATYLRSLVQSFGCNYICLWFYLPQPNQSRLYFLDGYYDEETNAIGSSTGSLARRLFEEYRREVFFIVNDRVPGMAFVNEQLYRELNESELQRMASAAVQQQFYKEARIKTAVFIGCRSGEIEMGWSNGMAQINMENPYWPSSSSLSMRSLSMDSADCSPLLFNIPSTSSAVQQVSQSQRPVPTTTGPLQLAIQSLQPAPSTTSPLQPAMQSTSNHQVAMREFALTRNVHLPSQESEDAAMISAILAVLTSPSSSTNSSITSNLPYNYCERQRASAFKNYQAPTRQTRQNLRRQSMLKRAITYYRSLNFVRRQHMLASRPSNSQLLHVISERRRREKINETFEALRKLLPPVAKKDKASVLNRTREYLTSLNAEIEKLSKKNKQLEAQLQQFPAEEVAEEEGSESSNERLELRVTQVSETTSEAQRIIDLQVVIRGESPVQEMVIRILEFLNQVNNVNVIFIEANTRTTESRSAHRVSLRLKIEGEEWEESAFQEAIRRVVADLAQ